MNILSISPQVVCPPDIGGKIRVYKIYEFLSKKNSVFQFSYNLFRYSGKLRLYSWENKINSNFVEYCYSPPWALAFSFLTHKLNISPLFYLNELMQFHFPSLLRNKINSADIIQVEQPWQFNWVYKEVKGNKKIIVDSHEVEYIMVKNQSHLLHKSPLRNKILEKIFRLEKDFANKSDLLFCTSKEDALDFQKLYGTPKEKIKIIPNGVDTSEFKKVSDNEREKSKKEMGLNKKQVILFVGGFHYPNQEALSFIKKLASKTKDKNLVFLVVGGVGAKEKSTKNIYYSGRVSHDDLIKYFKSADIALNPMFSGSGTNIKLLQYLSLGIPTITTKFGARGLELSNKRGALVKETEAEFINAIHEIINNDSLKKQLQDNSRKMIIGKYDFDTIVKKVNKYYNMVV